MPSAPAQLPARAIGAYGRGCAAGALALAPEGPGWQVMRPSRNRNFGHPRLVAWIEAFAAQARADGWPGLLVGDMAQPRGGPMLTGHASRQLGLEADLWLTPAPAGKLLTPEERDWLRKLRPWAGHSHHVHVSLRCPDAGCAGRNPIPAGDGCGRELAQWFRAEMRFPKPDQRPQRILKLKDLPAACRAVLAAP